MALQLTLSSNEDNTETGPTLIHSTGVEHYKIPPDVIRILQDSLTNDLLSDHAEGVLCQVAPQRVLDVLLQNGFQLQNQSNEDGKAVWTVVQGGSNGEDAERANDQNPRSTDEGEAEGDAEGGGGGGDGDQEGENEDEGQEE